MAVERLSVSEAGRDVAKLASRRRPVVIEGALTSWPIMRSGDGLACLDYLSARIGSASISYAEVPASANGYLSYRAPGSLDPTYRTVHRGFAEFAASLRTAVSGGSSSVCYMQSMSVAREFPALQPELALPLLADTLMIRGDSPRLWVGTGGHRVATHYDPFHNFACVVAGRKRFVVFPPEQLPNIYVGSLSPGDTPAGAPISLVDPRAPDLEKYPRFEVAMRAAETIDLGAGEVLFLPAYWFHYVESSDLNILVNFWWDDVPMRASAQAFACLPHALLTIRDLPSHRRDVLGTFFDYFVFQRCGDPYAHLEHDQQGWAGRLSRVEANRLRKQVVEAANHLLVHVADSEFEWDRPWIVSDAVTVAFDRAGEMRAHHREVGTELRLSPAVFEVLRLFSPGSTPEAVAGELASRYGVDRADFEACVRQLISEGWILPAGESGQ
jgi:hypothetical protein